MLCDEITLLLKMGFISEIPNVSPSCSFEPLACCIVFSCIHELYKNFILLVVDPFLS